MNAKNTQKIRQKTKNSPWGWGRGALEVEWVRKWNGGGAPPPPTGQKIIFWRNFCAKVRATAKQSFLTRQILLNFRKITQNLQNKGPKKGKIGPSKRRSLQGVVVSRGASQDGGVDWDWASLLRRPCAILAYFCVILAYF